MKRLLYYILPIFSLLLGSCTDRDELFGGEGNVIFSVDMISNITDAKTRALTEEEQKHLSEICFVQIYNADNKLIRNYQGLSTVPEELKLMAGDYTVIVTAGERIPSSFTEKYYEGKKVFTVTKGCTAQVEVKCNIVNTLVSVIFDESLKNSFSYYSVNVTANENATLAFNEENIGAIGYFNVPIGSKLTSAFNGITIDNKDYPEEFVIPNVKPATHYKLIYKLSLNDNEGGAGVDLEIKEEPIEVNEEEIIIYQRPKINIINLLGENINKDSDINLDVNSTDLFQYTINTSCPILDVSLESEKLIELGFETNKLNLYTLSTADLEVLTLKGLKIERASALDGPSSWKIELSETLIQKITDKVGVYSFLLSVTDEFKNNTTSNLNFYVTTEFPIFTSKINPSSVWARSAVLKGSIKSDPIVSFAFRYKKTNENVWTIVPAICNGTEATAEITTLTPDTEYEYQAMDGDNVSDLIYTFKTEATLQLQNTGFENWSKPGKPWLLYGNGESMWWDSGNHGSVSMIGSPSITTPDGEVKNRPESKNSAKLSSQFVGIGTIGKFAAGNAFAGQYLKTDGTDGILGFGRPFISRPKALKGYLKYEPGAVTHSKVPSDIDFPVGSTDIGTIYIALGDWPGEVYGGTTWPIIVKTKPGERQLFDPNGPNVIAYGVKDWREVVGKNGMVEFEIPIEYRTTDRKPTHIIIVASASKYGDYFSGGNSIMWIDDFELIYE